MNTQMIEEIKRTGSKTLPVTPALKKLEEFGLTHCGIIQLASFHDEALEHSYDELLAMKKFKKITNPMGLLIKKCNDYSKENKLPFNYRWKNELMEVYGYSESTPSFYQPTQSNESGYTYGKQEQSTQPKSTKTFVWTDSGRKELNLEFDDSYLNEPRTYELPYLDERWKDVQILSPRDFIDNIKTLPMTNEVMALVAELFSKKAISGIYQVGDTWGFIPNEAGIRRIVDAQGRNLKPKEYMGPRSEAAAKTHLQSLIKGQKSFMARYDRSKEQANVEV